MKLNTAIATALLTTVSYPIYAQTNQTQAQEGKPNAEMARPAAASDRHMRVADGPESNRLEQALKSADGRADYRRILEKEGYRISSINADNEDYLEYEIVKADQSYEVQLDFDDGARKATGIDVARNLWRAESTDRMLADSTYRPSSPLVADADSRYSDRMNMKRWTDEKDRLEQALETNLKPSDYRAKLEDMGYQVTSVNDNEQDYVEYEIVKGDDSYEVQIDLDEQTRLGKEIDVTSNLWESDETERRKGES